MTNIAHIVHYLVLFFNVVFQNLDCYKELVCITGPPVMCHWAWLNKNSHTPDDANIQFPKWYYVPETECLHF
jgi:hypothetical protein